MNKSESIFYEVLRLILVVFPLVFIAISVNEIAGRDSLLSRLEKEQNELLKYRLDMYNGFEDTSTTDIEIEINKAMIKDLKFLIVHGWTELGLIRDEILEYHIISPETAKKKLDNRINREEAEATGRYTNSELITVGFKSELVYLNDEIELYNKLYNSISEEMEIVDFEIIDDNGDFNDDYVKSLYLKYIDDDYVSYGTLEEFLQAVKVAYDTNSETTTTEIKSTLESISIDLKAEIASSEARKEIINRKLNEMKADEGKVDDKEKNNNIYEEYYLESQSNDTLLLIVFLSSGVLGATIVTMRKEDVKLSFELVLIGASTGVILYFIVKGGPKIFVDQVIYQGVNTANPYSCALFGLLGGLFSERVYIMLDGLLGGKGSDEDKDDNKRTHSGGRDSSL
ncbi:hypothetical protein [Grimontia celer]|uniref:hypothetical protein n=1 Tax=Grimontia celer TaxID=1796497 RepID=UPI0018D44CC3|nr:hypothetical protein [Grimontia celer]